MLRRQRKNFMKKTGCKELAKEAGVSFKTVYRVLNHEANVRKETRDRVLEVLSRNGWLDYFPARSGSVVIIANLLIPYYALRGTELLGLLSTEFNCFIFDSLRNRKKIVRSMEVSDIVVCFGAIPDGLETELRNANPAVRIVNAYGRGGDISILVDECELGCSAAKYLAERGHRKIWIPMQKRTDCLESIPRTWMFKSYMQEHFPETDVRFVNYEDFDEILTASPFPDAIWAPRSGDADFACSRVRPGNFFNNISVTSASFAPLATASHSITPVTLSFSALLLDGSNSVPLPSGDLRITANGFNFINNPRVLISGRP